MRTNELWAISGSGLSSKLFHGWPAVKIIAIIENSCAAGGGFNQALNAILQMKRICNAGNFAFEVRTSFPGNLKVLEELGVSAQVLRLSLYDRVLCRLEVALARFRLKLPFEEALIRDGCDLVYWVNPTSSFLALQRLNYIATVWDLSHRDSPEFPEVRNFRQFQSRERIYQRLLAPAVFTLVDSRKLAESAAKYYGVDDFRFLVMPFAPSPFLNQENSEGTTQVLSLYGLERGYLFYPAQFWSHKNHIRILESLLVLRARGVSPRFVFIGGDQGSQAHVKEFARLNALEEQVRFLDFVPSEHIRGLYDGCCAVVMPTYFGHTNLPPLEAWTMGKPLVYTAYFREQAGDAAICIDPDDSTDLANAIAAVLDLNIASVLVKAGRLRLEEINREREVAEAQLLSRLTQFSVRRRCWA